MKKIAILSIIASTLLAFSCQKDNKTLTLVLSETNPLDSVVGQMDIAFKEKVEELSNGKIKIDIQHSGSLGDEPSILRMMMGENPPVHLARISPFSATKVGFDKAKLLTIPFTFSNRDAFWNFLKTDAAKEILYEPMDKNLGVRGLFYSEEGFRHFFSVKPLKTIEDFENVKLRVSADPIIQALASGLKVQKVENIEISNLYAKIQTGQVEAAEQPISNYLSNHLNKVAPYMILSGHTIGVVEVVVSESVWQNMTEQQRDIIEEAGRYASEYCKLISQQVEDSAIDQLKEEGVTFYEIEDIKPWQNACSKIVQEISIENIDLYDKILKSN